MYNFKFFVSVAAMLVLIFPTDNEVTGAPSPAADPCLRMLGYDRRHREHTTTATAKPDVVEDFAKLRNKQTNQLEKLFTDWIMWGSSSEGQKPRTRNALDRMISGYMKFLANILKMV